MRVPQFLREIKKRNGTLVGISFQTEDISRIITDYLGEDVFEYERYRPGREVDTHEVYLEGFLSNRPVSRVLLKWNGGSFRTIIVCGPYGE